MNWNIERRKKEQFMRYFDGTYDHPPISKSRYGTYGMGVCKLTFNRKTNTLTVWLRRPGLLIGKGGETYNALKEYLECEIQIKEVILTNPKKSI